MQLRQPALALASSSSAAHSSVRKGTSWMDVALQIERRAAILIYYYIHLPIWTITNLCVHGLSSNNQVYVLVVLLRHASFCLRVSVVCIAACHYYVAKLARQAAMSSTKNLNSKLIGIREYLCLDRSAAAFIQHLQIRRDDPAAS